MRTSQQARLTFLVFVILLSILCLATFPVRGGSAFSQVSTLPWVILAIVTLVAADFIIVTLCTTARIESVSLIQ